MRCINRVRFILLTFILWGVLGSCKGLKTPVPPASPTFPLMVSSTPINTPTVLSIEATAAPLLSLPAQVSAALPPPAPLPSSSTPSSTSFPQTSTHHTLYTLSATLDYAAHSLSVEEHVVYRNDTPSHLAYVSLVVEPARYPGAFHLTSLSWEDGSRITQYQLREFQLTLNLTRPLPPGEFLKFSLTYTLKLPDTSKLANLRPYPFGYTYMQTNLGDWYPFIPPYDEQKGWLIHEPGFYGEHLVYDIADFDVDIHLTGEQTDLVLAASAPVQIEGDHLHYHHPAARNFAWSVSPHYQVITQTVEIPGSSPITVSSYFFPFYEQAGERIASTITQALPLYSRLFGVEYTHPLFSAVQADFLDGMEYDGMFFLSKDFYNWFNGSTQDFLVALAAHETAHQWFYGLVGNDQALEPWLDEAMCTYSERLFYENLFPESLDWWWSYRIHYYQPKGWVDTDIYDTPQVAGQYRAYRDAVYLNGAIFLEELRTHIGDQAFFGALRSYLSQYRYGQGTTTGFFENLSRFSDMNLESLLDQHFSP